MSASESARASGGWRLAVGLSVVPLVVGAAALAAPAIRLGEQGASMFSFGGASVTAILGVAVAATFDGSRVVRGAIAAGAVAVLVVAALVGGESGVRATCVDTALVAGAWAIGTAIGRRIEHPGHLFPACVVVASADVVSVVSSFGPTHAVAESDRALSLFAISFPVPGTNAFAPALGVGDLVFVAIVLGAVSAHRLPFVRAASLCLMGTLIAGAASALLESAVPALVPIGAAVVLGLPAVRMLRREDRRVAMLAMAITATIAAATIASHFVTRYAFLNG